MIKTGLNAKMENSHDLAVVYTPGVAAPCLAIKEEEDKSLELTWREMLSPLFLMVLVYWD